MRVRLDRKARAISLLVVLGIRKDGQNRVPIAQARWEPGVLLAMKTMGGESEAAWRGVLDEASTARRRSIARACAG